MHFLVAFTFVFFGLVNLVASLEVDQNVLILTTAGDDGVQTAIATLKSYGVPFEVLSLTSAGIMGNISLEHAEDYGKYSLIVFTSDSLAILSQDGTYVPALTADQFQQLDDYRAKYGVRQVTFNAYPNPTKHFATALGGCCNSGEHTAVFTANTPVSAAGIQAGAKLSTIGLYHYPATITNATMAKPILNFLGGEQAGFISNTVGGVIVKNENGLENMVFFISFGSWSTSSLVLGHIWIMWGTRGIFQGVRRSYLNTQVDDFFLDTESPIIPGVANTTYRTTTTDMNNIRSWLEGATGIRKRLPTGSKYTIELAYNGNGVLAKVNPDIALDIDTEDYVGINFIKTPGGGENRWPNPAPTDTELQLSNPLFLAKDPLFAYFMDKLLGIGDQKPKYFWLSHTFTHENLNNASYRDTDLEIKTNVKIAKQLGVYTESYFSQHSIVTPQISGVFNVDALRALRDNGITSIVGDNSRSQLVSPLGIWYPVITTLESSNFVGYTIIPRSACEVYYHCSTSEQNTFVYNSIYQGLLGPSTHEQIMEREANRVLLKLLLLHPDAYMFHQANLRKPSTTVKIGSGSGTYSLLQQWVEHVVYKYTQYANWPLISLKQDDMAKIFTNRVARDACGLTTTLLYDSTGKNITSIRVSAKGTCEVPITISNNLLAALVSNGRVEILTGQPPTVWLKMIPQLTTTFKLLTPVAVKA